MGMAASQARYIALTARKSNVEYEGQQINQARVSLANQSANLFNQMMGMEVPTPPSTTDFTTIQYSFSDGVNTEVLSNYYQLGNSDSDYNYVVTTYHNEKVYTGSKKKLNDPQVQATQTNHFTYSPTSTDDNTSMNVSKAWKNQDGTYGLEATDGSTTIFRPVTVKEEDQVRAINKGNGVYEDQAAAGDAPSTNGLFKNITIDGAGTFNADNVNSFKYDGSTFQKVTYNTAGTGMPDGTKDIIDSVIDGATNTDVYYVDENGRVITDDDLKTAETNYGVGGATNPEEPIAIREAKGESITGDPATENYFTDGKKFISRTDLDNAVAKYDKYVATGKKEPNEVNFITPKNDPTFSNYSAVGNCTLTELKAADLEDEDVWAELEQIMKDMKGPNGDKVAAENFAACFDTDENGDLVYKGGIYKFQMGGTTYYTTKNDLDASLGTSIVDNGIDVQQGKLNYYNASYLETKVEETQKALLETDGKGRFKTVKFEDDSVVYTLNTETVTDDAAYQDAMNRYYYENAEYEKMIADINAKTEILQAQDRTLELRMEQLATEQSALQNEMEAVKKVVDKHVELGFKTFGG